MTLDVRVEDLDGGLDKTASGEMLVVLDERQPRLQELVVGLHVDHVVLVQLAKTRSRSQSDTWEDELRFEGGVTHHLLQGGAAAKRAGEQREAVDEGGEEVSGQCR